MLPLAFAFSGCAVPDIAWLTDPAGNILPSLLQRAGRASHRNGRLARPVPCEAPVSV